MRTIKRKVRLHKRGSALAFVISTLVVLLVMGAGLLNVGLQSRLSAARVSSEIAARSAADAGLAKALFEINAVLTAQDWASGELKAAFPVLAPVKDATLANCDATYSYTIARDILGTNTFEIASVGKSGRTQKVIYATIRLKGLWEQAILTQKSLILKSDTYISGYNSQDLTDTDVEVQIGTLGVSDDEIVLNPGVVVEGEVLVGVGGNPDTVIKDLGATTKGRYALMIEPALPTISEPALPEMGKLDIKKETLKIGPADNGMYTEISAINAAILEIAGGDVVIHVTGDISLGQACDIIITPGSSLTIYLDGDIVCGNEGGIDNQTGFPGNFELYGTGEPVQQWDLKAKSEAFGVIYAPGADITVNAKGDIGSSIVGNNVEFKSGGNFLYDEALKDVSLEDEGVRFVVDRWREG